MIVKIGFGAFFATGTYSFGEATLPFEEEKLFEVSGLGAVDVLGSE